MQALALGRGLLGRSPRDEDRIPDAALRQALDETLLAALRPILLVLVILTAVLLLAELFPSPEGRLFFVAQNLASSLFFLSLFLAVGRWRPGRQWAHPLATLIAAALMLASVTTIVIGAEPTETFGVTLLILGVSFFCTSTPWYVGIVTGILAAWGLAVKWGPPSEMYYSLTFVLIQGVLLSVMVFVVRMRTLTRLQDLRWRDARLSGQLSEAQDLVHLGSWEWNVPADVVRWSDETYRIFGLEQGTPIDFGRFLRCVHSDDRDFVEQTVQRALRFGTPWSFEHRVVRPNGDVRTVHGNGRVATDEQRKPIRMFGTVLDVTEQRVGERRRAAQHAATRVIAKGASEEETMRTIIEVVADALDWKFGAVWLVDPRDDVLRCVSTWRASAVGQSEFEERTRARTFVRGIGLPGRVWASGEAAWIEDVTMDPNFPRAPYAARAGIHGAFGFPIKVDSQTLGMIEFFSTGIEKPDAELLRMMSTIGTQLGQFIERRRTDQALRESEERFRLLAENARDVIYRYRFTKPRGFEYVSPAAEHILGYAPEEYYADPDLAFRQVHPDDRTILEAAIREPRRPLILRVGRKDGRTVWIEQRGAFTYDEAGNPIAVEGIARDVTSLKEAEEQLRRQRDDLARLTEQLRSANRDLESFAYSASHDLRAPLRAIDQLGRILEEEESEHLGEAGKDALARSRKEAARMGQLIEDLLKLSRSTIGELHRERVDLSKLARDVIEALRGREPGRDVRFDVASGIECDGDERFLRVAIENLLGNAWKYTSQTPQARIEVGVMPGESSQASTYYVRDNGVGFDPAKGAKLFQPFQRLHGREFPGTGVGLATVRRIIERHGGHVWAESQPGSGATFFFTLGQTPPPIALHSA